MLHYLASWAINKLHLLIVDYVMLNNCRTELFRPFFNLTVLHNVLLDSALFTYSFSNIFYFRSVSSPGVYVYYTAT
jgi:hypothetical protein